MERLVKRALSVALLVSALAVQAAQVPAPAVASPVVSQYRIRPQSLNGARKVAGEVPGSRYTHLPDMEEWYASFTITPAYQKSIRSNQIARSLFGDSLIDNPTTTTNTNNSCKDSCGKVVLIQGDQVNDGKPVANSWRANDFNLPADYNGFLTFKPTISNFILDFNFYAGFDEFVRGMYLRVYAPFVHTKWNLNMKETIINPENIPVDPAFLASASEFFAGAPIPKSTYNTAPAGTTADVIRNPLTAAKMFGGSRVANNTDKPCDTSCSGSQTQNGFGEIRAEFGWDFLRNEDYHLGIYAAAAAPTGNKAKSEFLFSPVVGNGKHWELGGGLSGHWVFWRSECEEHHLGFYTDAVVTHLFKADEHRVFDLKGKPLSRWMAAAKMTTPVTNNLQSSPTAGVGDATNTPAQVQWANELSPVANLVAQDISVSIGAQVDLTAWFNYTAGGFSWDLGYNLWLQTCENISCAPKCGPKLATEKDTWVLVGNTRVTGRGATDELDYPLSVSNSKATLINGTPTDPVGFSLTNEDADNATGNSAFAVNTPTGGAAQELVLIGLPVATAPQMHISIPVVYINAEDINYSQKSKGLSNKVWTHFSYTWDRECVVPYVGIGGEVEFGSGSSCKKECAKTTVTTMTTNKDDCSSCLNSAVSQWGVWAKIGVQFD